MNAALTSLLLVRHAESPWTADEQRPLSAAGDAAARALVTRLRAFDIAAIYASPYRRAVQTVVPMASARNLRIETIADLRERKLGDVDDDRVNEAIAATWADFDLVHLGGESSRAAQQRAFALVESLAARHAGQCVLVATHGNLLALLLNSFGCGVGFEFWRALQFPDAFHLRIDAAGNGTFERV